MDPGKKKQEIPTSYSIHNQVLETTDSNKFLVVTIANDLTWSNKVDEVAAKGNRAVGFLRRNFSNCPTKIKAASYVAMACPILEYASTAWDPRQQGDITKLEKGTKKSSQVCYQQLH